MDTSYPPDDRVMRFVESRLGRAGMTQDPGTRLYRVREHWPGLQEWVHQLQAAFGGELLPFEWVPDYVRVTRAAVHKRVRKGQLTVFAFEALDEFASVLGVRPRPKMRAEYRYVPRTECDIWLLSSIQHPERSDVRTLRTPHIPGWWNEVEL